MEKIKSDMLGRESDASKPHATLPGVNAFLIVCLATVIAVLSMIVTSPPQILPAADAGPIASSLKNPPLDRAYLRRRQSSSVCRRWSHQSKPPNIQTGIGIGCSNFVFVPAAVVNGTLYIYGGRSSTSGTQTSNTWSKFLPLFDTPST